MELVQHDDLAELPQTWKPLPNRCQNGSQTSELERRGSREQEPGVVFLDLLSLRLSLPCSETQSFNCFSISDKGLAKGSACEAWRDGTCRKSGRLDVGPGAHDYVDCRNVIVWLNSVETALRRGRSDRFARTRDLQDDGGDDFCDRPTTYPPNRLTSFEPLAASICWPVKSEPALNPIVMRFLTRRAACFSLE